LPVATGTEWARLIIYLTHVAEKEKNKTRQAEWPVIPEILLKLHEESCRNFILSIPSEKFYV